MLRSSDELKQDINLDVLIAGQALSLTTTWGLFSPRAIDEGTQLLADQLSLSPTDTCLDLGCGYGVLGLIMARLAPQGITHMVDKDFVAVDYANTNAHANHIGNAKAFLSNGFSNVPPGQRYNVIVSNIPAKIGGELLAIFIQDAYDHLEPGGQFYVVTISGLKEYMKRHFIEVFGTYEKLKQSRTYTAALATKKA